MAGYPMPGQTDFTADEEQQMRQGQANIAALSTQANSGAKPAAAPVEPAGNKEAGLDSGLKALGAKIGGAMNSSGGGDEGDDDPSAGLNTGNLGGTGGLLGDMY